MAVDLSQIGIGIGVGSAIVTFAGNWLFATKRDLADSNTAQSNTLRKHEEKERAKGDEQSQRLFDKLDALRNDLADLRVEVANRYARRRTTDPESPA